MKFPLKDHPLMQEAQLIRDLLAEDSQVARKGTGRVVIAGNPDLRIPQLKAEATQLERLARLDLTLGLYPPKEED